MRDIVDGIFYVVRDSQAWQMLPHDYPPWQTVYHSFRQWRLSGLWQRLLDTLREWVRTRAGRNAQPSAKWFVRQMMYNSGTHQAPEGTMTIRVRSLTEAEAREIQRLARSRTEPARRVERATIIRLSAAGKSPPQIGKALQLGAGRVRDWVQRFNAEGLAGLQDQPRSGAPRTYDEETVGVIIVSALTDPLTLGLPFNAWTLDRLTTYLHEHKGVQMKRSRIGDILVAEGLRWRQEEKWFGERVDPQFAEKRGASRSCTSRRRKPA